MARSHVPNAWLRAFALKRVLPRRNEVVVKEPANINTTTVHPTATATVYGMPAYTDRAAAAGKCTRPHLLIQAPAAYCSSLS
jgi:hypothetical protein